jgi:hypothetical protein
MANEPKHGHADGLPVHARTRHFLMPSMLRISPTLIKRDAAPVDGFNAKVAVRLTRVVGTMWAFWVFNRIALISLPAAIQTGSSPCSSTGSPRTGSS